MSGASEQANGRASGPVFQSVFLVVLDHSALTFFLTKAPTAATMEKIPTRQLLNKSRMLKGTGRMLALVEM